ncbi:hypothetical protein [Pandoraea oxalativorans]|uniref:hypothetical protein n=1 Tax=Pandoraea oxalativorans TaxID=573737 RepID=UPI0012F4B874|nr:hypothetical protein [Pandoraea oxalativorans]
MPSNACAMSYKKGADAVFDAKTHALNLIKIYTEEWSQMCGNTDALDETLGEVKRTIQTRRNNSSLGRDEIFGCVAKIKLCPGDSYQTEQAKQAVDFLKCCILIARHEDGFLHSLNTKLNRNTDSMNKALKNDSYYQIQNGNRIATTNNPYNTPGYKAAAIQAIERHFNSYTDLVRFDTTSLPQPSTNEKQHKIPADYVNYIREHMQTINGKIKYSPTAEPALMSRLRPDRTAHWRSKALQRNAENVRCQ